MCIQSIANSGLKQRVVEYYKREIIQVYGFEHMLTMNNLEKCGLLRVQVI
jgi:vacuolar protein sorting-associated protein 33A